MYTNSRTIWERKTYQDKNNSGIVSQWSEIISENNYYPFGLTHKGYNNVVNAHPYDYNGKENNEELGLNSTLEQEIMMLL